MLFLLGESQFGDGLVRWSLFLDFLHYRRLRGSLLLSGGQTNLGQGNLQVRFKTFGRKIRTRSKAVIYMTVEGVLNIKQHLFFCIFRCF